MAFGRIIEFFTKITELSPNQLMSQALDDQTMQAQILDLNTESQLYERGIDADSKSLGGYAPFTIEYKETIAGQMGNDTRTANVTLKDTGEFYRSFRFVKAADGFHIEADTEKDGGVDLAYLYGPKILGLTNESRQQIIPDIRERMLAIAREKIRT